jgi:hypothetical protein
VGSATLLETMLFQGRWLTPNVYTVPLGRCDVDWYVDRGIVVVACMGRDMIKVWPLLTVLTRNRLSRRRWAAKEKSTGKSYSTAMKTIREYSLNCWKKGRTNLNSSVIVGFMALILGMVLPGCSATSLPELSITPEPGQVVEGEDVFGTFYTYVPTTVPEKPLVLVLVHGTPPRSETAKFNAHYYAAAWSDFAEKNGFILVAPAFNQEDFSSRLGDHALGGYRGLFGREIGADAWVLRLVRAHQQVYGMEGERFYLYGHSAGGQFTGRFVVTHPEQVKAAVITSAATYPQPAIEVAWPFGMGELDTEIVWDGETSQAVNVVPDKEKWLEATQVPLTVIVGLNDTEELPASLIPGQKGKNRCVIGQNWVQDMALFAESNGLESRCKLSVVPGIGHSMSGLLSYSQAALLSE